MNKGTTKTGQAKVWMILFLAIFLTGLTSTQVLAHEPYTIKIMTLQAGSSTYIQGVAFTDIINKNSKWLKAVLVEGKTSGYNLKMLVSDPDLRKTTFVHLPEPTLWEAKQGMPLYKGVKYDFDKVRYVFFIGVILNAPITLNPDIKTLADLKGKRVVVGFRPTSDAPQELFYYSLKAAGLSKDDIKPQYMSYNASHDALKDGLVDVVQTGGSLMEYPNKWVLSPFAIQVVDTKHTYFISYDPHVIDKMRAETGNPFYPMVVPANSFRNQKDPWIISAKYMGWAVTTEMADDVVEEVLRLVYDHCEVFGEYVAAGKMVTQKTLGMMGSDLKHYHPVALKFYKEKNVPVGQFSFTK